MQIFSVIEFPVYQVETDDEPYPVYRRTQYGEWENRLGEVWAPCYYKQEELESLLQDYLEENGDAANEEG